MRGLELPAQLLMAYFLIHFRFVGMMFSSPLFSTAVLPTPFRYLCAVVLTVASAGAVNGAVAASVIPMAVFESWISVSALLLREFLIITTLLMCVRLLCRNAVIKQVGRWLRWCGIIKL